MFNQAHLLQKVGSFALVIEHVPSTVASKIRNEIQLTLNDGITIEMIKEALEKEIS